MRELEKGVILPGPGQAQVVDNDGVREISIREATRLDRFAEELSQALGIPVTVIEEEYSPLASDLVLCQTTTIDELLSRAPEAAPRCVVFDVSDPLAVATTHNVAAAIGLRSYNLWRIRYSKFAPEIVGLKRVAAVASELVLGADESGDYVSFGGPEGVELPALLASYLRAYQSLP